MLIITSREKPYRARSQLGADDYVAIRFGCRAGGAHTGGHPASWAAGGRSGAARGDSARPSIYEVTVRARSHLTRIESGYYSSMSAPGRVLPRSSFDSLSMVHGGSIATLNDHPQPALQCGRDPGLPARQTVFGVGYRSVARPSKPARLANLDAPTHF